jgi:nucleoside-diphosphate-sugar epimerase
MNVRRAELLNVLVTGGNGYIGSSLIPELLHIGLKVTCIDLMIYGNNCLPKHPLLTVVRGDVRNLDTLKNIVSRQDVIIHLAFVSNDPGNELDPEIARSINVDSFRPLVELSVNLGVKKFIFLSSCSVYGIQSGLASEKSSVNPLTAYAHSKLECELILNEYYSDAFSTVILRPATVCGVSKRQRLDLIFNRMTSHAFYEKKILVRNGEQVRPSIHISDLVRAIVLMVRLSRNKIAGEAFNIAFENRRILESAELIRSAIGGDIEIESLTDSDMRSYSISSRKITQCLDFKPYYSVNHAVLDLVQYFKSNTLSDPLHNPLYHSRKMEALCLCPKSRKNST